MNLKLTTALIALAVPALADGPTVPRYDPPVQPLPVPPSTFAGGYVGLSFGRTTETTNIDDIYVRECQFGDAHKERKCAYGGHEDSVEIAALERNHAPWKNFPGGDPIVYDEHRFIMYGEADSVFTYTTSSGGDPMPVAGKDALNVLVDTISESETTESGIGAFAGYRWELTRSVLAGVEVSTDGTLSTAEANLGYACGNVLGYVFAGGAQYDGLDSAVYGAGLDYRVSENWTVGGKFTAGDFGDTTTETAALRVAFNF